VVFPLVFHKNNPVIRTLRLRRHYDYLKYNLDWMSITIDDRFISHYGKKLTLVIGTYDNLIEQQDSPILEKCNVVYVNTVHGLTMMSDYMSWI
jgi:hypothetical protein